MLYVLTAILETKKHKRRIIILTEQVVRFLKYVSTYSRFRICWIQLMPLQGSTINNAKLLLEDNTCREHEASPDFNAGYWESEVGWNSRAAVKQAFGICKTWQCCTAKIITWLYGLRQSCELHADEPQCFMFSCPTERICKAKNRLNSSNKLNFSSPLM